uniref:NADH-ubiquinone oxidoreductase chain 4L n=1 Tax=Staphylinoidea sp. 6 KM-2017 TaxID=2219460 RepID=A0A346RJU8_9COLE|nr:NADH dehydrogenase subunit 4L [Staphylinoidea sp. 6 KM-2017]
MLILLISMFFSGALVFAMKRKHLLLVLMSLEFLVLSLFLNMLMSFSVVNFEIYFVMIFLSMSVCEGAIGLALLVSLIRTHGNDYFNSFNVLW